MYYFHKNNNQKSTINTKLAKYRSFLLIYSHLYPTLVFAVYMTVKHAPIAPYLNR